MSFKDEFLRTPSGPIREALIYQAAIKQGPPKNLVPVTVPGPNGTKITYKVMADYMMIDGIRVPMTPLTAQKIANYFGMSLPTDKMSKQIYNAADTKVRAAPLSGSGYVSPLTGKKYSPQEVVKNRIGESDAAVYYSKLTDEAIAKSKGDNKPVLIGGHGKEITEPTSSASVNDVSFGGWQGAQGDALQPYTYAHKGQAAAHTEYALNTRLIDGNVTITLPNGKTISTTMDKLRSNPNLSSAIANTTVVRQYGSKNKESPSTTKIEQKMTTHPVKQITENYNPNKPQSGRLTLLQRIDSLLNQFGK